MATNLGGLHVVKKGCLPFSISTEIVERFQQGLVHFRKCNRLRIVSKEESPGQFAFARNEVIRILGKRVKLVLIEQIRLRENRQPLAGKGR